jgi:transposase
VHAQPEAAKAAILHLVRRDPHQLGYDRARWTLALLRTECDWLRVASDASLAALLARLGISYKRGREYVHSPDPDYQSKLQDVDQIVAQARTSDGRLVALYLDELTYYRQPTLAPAYEARGRAQPLAVRSHRANTPTRLVGALNVVNGRTLYRQASRLGIAELVKFHRQIREAYPAAERLYLIEDNWPIHFHPDVLVALEAQEHPWPLYRPRHWSLEASVQAVKKWGSWQLPIQLVPLPTYASWTNPIEKLWRWLKQAVLPLHRRADHLDRLRQEVCRFLDRFADGSLDLLHYVGLPVPI